MPSVRVSKELNTATYFVTFTVRKWHHILDKYSSWNILSNSIVYFIKNRDVELYSFVFMPNHIHLIIYAPDVAGFIRDFKKYTSKQIKQNLEIAEPKLLKLFINKHGEYQFWEKTNMPKAVYTYNFFQQKAKYIENNPVKKGWVNLPAEWYWSSANKDCELMIFKQKSG